MRCALALAVSTLVATARADAAPPPAGQLRRTVFRPFRELPRHRGVGLRVRRAGDTLLLHLTLGGERDGAHGLVTEQLRLPAGGVTGPPAEIPGRHAESTRRALNEITQLLRERYIKPLPLGVSGAWKGVREQLLQRDLRGLDEKAIYRLAGDLLLEGLDPFSRWAKEGGHHPAARRGAVERPRTEGARLLPDGTALIPIRDFLFAPTAAPLETRDTGALARELAARFARLARDAGRPVERVIVDLRGNGGGDLDVAARTLEVLLSEPAELLGVSDRAPRYASAIKPQGGPLSRARLAVLIDGGTASVAEAVALALQKGRGGLLVGQPTYKKGVFQYSYALGGSAAAEGWLSLTSGEMVVRIGGLVHRYHGHGVRPDVAAGDDSAVEVARRALDSDR